jgi:serine/threonine protein kinase
MSKIAAGSYATIYKYSPGEGDGELSDENTVIKYYRVPRGNGLSSAYREIEMLSHLRHPNIIRMTGIVCDKYRPRGELRYNPDRDGGLHILMEQARYTLSNIDYSAMQTETIKKVTLDILLGLSYLHRNGVIHRDLSPNNILLMKGDGRACICDMGMAKYYTSEIEVNDIYVHPFVRAPEMYALSSYDYRADVWSLGVIVATMLLGENPFEYLRSKVIEQNPALSTLPSSTKTTYGALAMILSHIPLCPNEEVAARWIRRCVGDVDATPLMTIVRGRREGALLSPLREIEKDDPQAYSFLECCLAFQRKDRMDTGGLLSHPWLSQYGDFISLSLSSIVLSPINPRDWREVTLPPSSTRREIKEYLESYGDSFAPGGQIDRCTSRICLSLNIYYRVLSSVERDVGEDTKRTLLSDMKKGRLFLLYLVCVAVTLKYCGTNIVPEIRHYIPPEIADILLEDFLPDREYMVIDLLDRRFYQHTTYDVLVQNGMRVSQESAQSVWMQYLGGSTKRRCVEREYETYIKQVVAGGKSE